jgi:hypothetical protein
MALSLAKLLITLGDFQRLIRPGARVDQVVPQGFAFPAPAYLVNASIANHAQEPGFQCTFARVKRFGAIEYDGKGVMHSVGCVVAAAKHVHGKRMRAISKLYEFLLHIAVFHRRHYIYAGEAVLFPQKSSCRRDRRNQS